MAPKQHSYIQNEHAKSSYDLDIKIQSNCQNISNINKKASEPFLSNNRTNIPYQHQLKEHSTGMRDPTTREVMRIPENVIASKIFKILYSVVFKVKHRREKPSA